MVASGIYYTLDNETLEQIVEKHVNKHDASFTVRDLLLQNYPIFPNLTETSKLQKGTALRIPDKSKLYCHCTDEFTRGDIQCGMCSSWLHRQCENIPESVDVASAEYVFVCRVCEIDRRRIESAAKSKTAELVRVAEAKRMLEVERGAKEQRVAQDGDERRLRRSRRSRRGGDVSDRSHSRSRDARADGDEGGDEEVDERRLRRRSRSRSRSRDARADEEVDGSSSSSNSSRKPCIESERHPWDRGDYGGPVNVKDVDATRRSGMDGWWYWQVTAKLKRWRPLLNTKKSAAATEAEARTNAKLLGKQYVEDPDAYPWDRGDYDGPVNVKDVDATRRSGMDGWWYWQVTAKLKRWRPLLNTKKSAAATEAEARTNAKLLGKQYVEDPDAYPWDRGDYDGPVNVKDVDATRRRGMDGWWYWQVNAKKWRPLTKKKK